MKTVLWVTIFLVLISTATATTIRLNETTFHRNYQQTGRFAKSLFIETWELGSIPAGSTIENATVCYKETTTFTGFPMVVCDNDLNLSIVNESASVENFNTNCDENCYNVNLSFSLDNFSKVWNQSNAQDEWYCTDAREQISVPFNLGWNNVSLYLQDHDADHISSNTYSDPELVKFGASGSCTFASGNFTNQTERPYIDVDYVINDPCVYPGGDWTVNQNCNVSFVHWTLTGNITISDSINLSFQNSNLTLNNYSIVIGDNSELNIKNKSNISSPEPSVGFLNSDNTDVSIFNLINSYVKNVMFDFQGTTSMTSTNIDFYHNSDCTEHFMEFNNTPYYRLENSTFIPLVNHSDCLIRFLNVTDVYINNNNFITRDGLYGDELVSIFRSTNVVIYNNTFYSLIRPLFISHIITFNSFNNTFVNVNKSTDTKRMFTFNNVSNIILNHTIINSTNNFAIFDDPFSANLYIERSNIKRIVKNDLRLANLNGGSLNVRNSIIDWDIIFATNGIIANFYNNHIIANSSFSFGYISSYNSTIEIHNDTFEYSNIIPDYLFEGNSTFYHLRVQSGSDVSSFDSNTNAIRQTFNCPFDCQYKHYKSSRFFVNSSEPENYNVTVIDNTNNISMNESIGLSGLSSYNYFKSHYWLKQGLNPLEKTSFNNFTAYAVHYTDQSLNANRSINFTLNNATYTIDTPVPANCDYTPPGDWQVTIKCSLNNVSRTVIGNTTVWTTGVLNLSNSTHFTTNVTTFYAKTGWIFLEVDENSTWDNTGGFL